MRLTIINQYYVPALAPTAHLCASLAEHRAQLGDDVTVVATRGGYGDAGHAPDLTSNAGGTSPGVKLISVWSPRLGGASELRRLIDWLTFYVLAFWKVLTLPRQDCLIALTTPPYIAWTAIFHRLLHRRAKVILWNMDCYPQAAELAGILPRGGWVGRLLRAVNRSLLRQIDHVVCLDEPMVRQVFESGDAPEPGRVSVIPNWEDLAMFPEAMVRRSPREDDRLKVLYLGNAGYGHDFTTLLDAGELIRDEPIDFLFVGGGSRIAWLKAECQRRHLANFSFRPYVQKSATPELMSQADCALITLEDSSLGIMSPSKLHASLAMGLPILYVGPAYSNVDAAVARFGCGCSLRVGDSAGLARFCRMLRSDNLMQTQLHLLARRGFAEAYCDRVTLPAFDRVIDKVVGRASQANLSLID